MTTVYYRSFASFASNFGLIPIMDLGDLSIAEDVPPSNLYAVYLFAFSIVESTCTVMFFFLPSSVECHHFLRYIVTRTAPNCRINGRSSSIFCSYRPLLSDIGLY